MATTTVEEILKASAISVSSMDLRNQIYNGSEDPIQLFSANMARGVAFMTTAYDSVRTSPENAAAVDSGLKDVLGIVFGMFLTENNEKYFSSVLNEDVIAFAKETRDILRETVKNDVKDSIDNLIKVEERIKNEEE